MHACHFWNLHPVTRMIEEGKRFMLLSVAHADPYEFRFYQYPRAEIASKMGVETAIIDTHNGRKSMEWFIPWQFVGYGGVRSPRAGTRLAFTPGYNDYSPSRPGETNKVRWIGVRSPWNFASMDGRNKSWGEIVLGPMLADKP
jgi:hypothetical protein